MASLTNVQAQKTLPPAFPAISIPENEKFSKRIQEAFDGYKHYEQWSKDADRIESTTREWTTWNNENPTNTDPEVLSKRVDIYIQFQELRSAVISEIDNQTKIIKSIESNSIDPSTLLTFKKLGAGQNQLAKVYNRIFGSELPIVKTNLENLKKLLERIKTSLPNLKSAGETLASRDAWRIVWLFNIATQQSTTPYFTDLVAKKKLQNEQTPKTDSTQQGTSSEDADQKSSIPLTGSQTDLP